MNRSYLIFGIGLPLLLLWGGTLLALSFLPETVPAHFGPGGVDRLGSRYELLSLPVLATLAALLALFKNPALRLAAALAVWIFAFAQGLVLALVFTHLGTAPRPPTPKEAELGERVLKGVLVLGGLVTAALGFALWKRPPPPNPYYGFRIRETLEDPEIWYPANRFAGAAMAAAGLAAAVAAFFLPSLYAAGVLALAVLLATLASYVYAKRLAKEKR